MPAVAPPPTDAGPKAESAVYRRWANFKPGTVVEYRETTDQPGQPLSEMITLYRIKEVADERVTVEVTVTFVEADGKLSPNPPQDHRHHRWVAGGTGDKPANTEGLPPGTTGPEEVKVTAAGREFAAQLYQSKGQVEAGPTATQTYLSDEVPGGLLKSVTTVIPTKRVTTTVVSKITTP
jgi:hypothetical protein